MYGKLISDTVVGSFSINANLVLRRLLLALLYAFNNFNHHYIASAGGTHKISIIFLDFLEKLKLYVDNSSQCLSYIFGFFSSIRITNLKCDVTNNSIFK